MLIKLRCLINWTNITVEAYKSNVYLYALLSNVYTQVATDASLLTINNNIALKATQSTTYTKLETYRANWNLYNKMK